MSTRKIRNGIRLGASYLVLVLLCIAAVYPVLWVVFGSLRPGKSLYSKTLIPEKFTLVHYAELFTSKTYLFGTWYLNTLKIAACSMVLGVLLVLLTSYALSRFRFRGRKRRCPACSCSACSRDS